jgi:mRNA-degrading endonuclease HigB of HigAB toxin-antitoxin module
MEFPESRIHLEAWLTIVKHAKWKTCLDVRQSFPGTDPVKLASGKTVYVFNSIENPVWSGLAQLPQVEQESAPKME